MPDVGTTAAPSPAPEGVSAFQFALLVLSLLLLTALAVDTVAPLQSEVSELIQTLDNIVCALLFVDVALRFRRAPNKWQFLIWGWVDVLACIPNIDVLRVGRLVRVLRLIRLIRGLRAGHRLASILLRDKPRGAMATALLTTLLLVTFTSVAILLVEKGDQANIRTAEDAVWWSISTITTVGYGDRFPTTTEGRVIAMVLMLSGVGLFGMLSGVVASLLAGGRSAGEPPELKEVLERLRRLERQLAVRDSHDPAFPAAKRSEPPSGAGSSLEPWS